MFPSLGSFLFSKRPFLFPAFSTSCVLLSTCTSAFEENARSPYTTRVEFFIRSDFFQMQPIFIRKHWSVQFLWKQIDPYVYFLLSRLLQCSFPVLHAFFLLSLQTLNLVKMISRNVILIRYIFFSFTPCFEYSLT